MIIVEDFLLLCLISSIQSLKVAYHLEIICHPDTFTPLTPISYKSFLFQQVF